MKYYFIRRLCRDVIGLVFCVSAVFKLMDPVGTGLIVEGYLKFLHLEFLLPLSLVLGEALSLCEALVAVGLLSGVFKRFFAIATTALLGFFTIISIVLWIANPDMDCGCFGQFIHLSHFQTFLKNVILSALAAITFLPVSSYELLPGKSLFAFATCVIIIVFFAVVSLFQIPPVEFTAYSSSHTIVSPDESTTDDEYPILYLWDNDAADRSEDILEGRVVLLSFYNPESADSAVISRTKIFIENAYNAGISPFVISAGNIDIDTAPVLFADFKDIITLNRSNGGATFLDDGYIIRKRSRFSLIEADELDEIASSDPTEAYIKAATWRSLTLQAFIVVFFAVLIFL